MKVTLETYGGLAAASRRPPEVLDTAALPAAAAAELGRLIAAAAADPAAAADGGARDAMGYTITMEDGPRTTTLEQSDATMTPAFRSLLTWLRARTAGGSPRR
ncbi:protealysin inhibitor emfourin [Streptomyces racemochromogenes]|uniref:Protealysin inhibitor emfourin n=1 Tax=Streptomyces racemochromogenes TaxID=67353 RepID=A0ABW7PBT3_9ACTN